MDRRILQIISATGFRAVYSSEPGDQNPGFEVPLACLALVEEADDSEIITRVVPFIMTDFSSDAEADNYLGCVGPGFAKESVGNIVVDYTRNDNQVCKIVRKKERIQNEPNK